jgi:hypothetical protein
VALSLSLVLGSEGLGRVVSVCPASKVPNPTYNSAFAHDQDIAAVGLAFGRVPLGLAAGSALRAGACVTVIDSASSSLVSVC